MQIRRVESTEELFKIADGDYFMRVNVPIGADMRGMAWADDDGTFAYLGADGSDGTPEGVLHWLDVIGRPAAGAELLRVALSELAEPPTGFTVPRGTEIEGHGIPADHAQAWDFMVWDAAFPGTGLPVQPAEELVEGLVPGPDTDAEVAAFLHEVNPHHSAKPGWEAIDLWGGIRSAQTGRLLAVGALCHRENDTPYLASIATHGDARGRGYGAAVTAWLTREGVERSGGLCTLAHYHPNEAARRIYLRLGYRTTHEMLSAELATNEGASV